MPQGMSARFRGFLDMVRDISVAGELSEYTSKPALQLKQHLEDFSARLDNFAGEQPSPAAAQVQGCAGGHDGRAASPKRRPG